MQQSYNNIKPETRIKIPLKFMPFNPVISAFDGKALSTQNDLVIKPVRDGKNDRKVLHDFFGALSY